MRVMAIKRFIHTDHKNSSFGRNVDIKRVMPKKRFFHYEYKTTFCMDKETGFFKVISKYRLFLLNVYTKRVTTTIFS